MVAFKGRDLYRVEIHTHLHTGLTTQNLDKNSGVRIGIYNIYSVNLLNVYIQK